VKVEKTIRQRTQDATRARRSTSTFKVGLAEQPVNGRYSPTALVRASYLTAVATRIDSFWLPDHLNSAFPRSVMTPKYVGAARLAPKVDAILEPWTVLGHLAARNRLARLRLGTAVTDTGRRNPAVTAQAAATLHLLTPVGPSWALAPASAKATNPTGWTGQNRWHVLKKRWLPFGPCGTRAASW
jgi:alkanesulfonate monooxygenase SsuD/methylene tetrahydromethanopterin reductase-like flavin-dependent oxidoreductase (luciferase family)